MSIRRSAKAIPGARMLARSFGLTAAPAKKFTFERTETSNLADHARTRQSVLNLLNYTKTSNAIYNAAEYPAAYHSLRLNGEFIRGQRDPRARLATVPYDFKGKKILDIGCNRGGMLLELADRALWCVGIDYDYRQINAANRIRSAVGIGNIDFYVFDLEADPLELVEDLLPEPRIDICFLLAVCMWIRNWRDVIDFVRGRSDALLFETNGTEAQQEEQEAFLRTKYRSVRVISEKSIDDSTQMDRKLMLLS